MDIPGLNWFGSASNKTLQMSWQNHNASVRVCLYMYVYAYLLMIFAYRTCESANRAEFLSKYWIVANKRIDSVVSIGSTGSKRRTGSPTGYWAPCNDNWQTNWFSATLFIYLKFLFIYLLDSRPPCADRGACHGAKVFLIFGCPKIIAIWQHHQSHWRFVCRLVGQFDICFALTLKQNRKLRQRVAEIFVLTWHK